MKYGELNLGQIEAIINKLGGEEGAMRFLRGELLVSAPTVTGAFKRDMRTEGWKLIENTSRRINSITDVEPVSFLKPCESHINGEEMVGRAIKLEANYGQEDVEYLLEHHDEIPAELQSFYLVFPGTIWEDSNGSRSVPFLYWHGHDRLLRPRNSLHSPPCAGFPFSMPFIHPPNILPTSVRDSERAMYF
ncbi:MAG: hypothetical protein AAB482_03255 [Patescibacteria group bacterium]